MKSHVKTMLPATLALTVILSGSATYVMAEHGSDNEGHGKVGVEQHVRHDGNKTEIHGKARVDVDAPKAVRKEAIKDFRKDFKEARHDDRVDRKEARKDAIDDKKDAFRDARHEFQEAVRERRDGHDHGRDLSDEFFDNRFIVDEDLARRIFVRGEPVDGNDFVLIRVTPSDEERLSRIFLDNRNDNKDSIWLGRLFHPEFKVGNFIEDDELSEIRLLPLSYNASFGLPVHEDFRLGVVNDQVLLLDMDRQLVLDALRFDNEGRLVSRELDIDNPRLLTFRLTPAEEANLRAYLVRHPELAEDNLTFGERFRENVLVPIGLSRVRIGERLPLLANPVYLPEPVVATTDLPGTDLQLAVVGNDLVLLDPDTRLVLDVINDIV